MNCSYSVKCAGINLKHDFRSDTCCRVFVEVKGSNRQSNCDRLLGLKGHLLLHTPHINRDYSAYASSHFTHHTRVCYSCT